MKIKDLLGKMREIQKYILEYIEKEDLEETLHNFKVIFKDHKIIDDNLMIVLRLISQISNEHYRDEYFDQKIEEIIKFFKDDIKKKYSNSAIFDIFKFNKKLLLFLTEERILTIDGYICKQMMKKEFKKMKYPEYFFPEIKQYLPTFIRPKKWGKNDNSFYNEFSNKLPEKFEEKRKIGENDDYICYLIRNDLIDEFITYINKNDISLETKIEPSIYETHPLLLKTRFIYTGYPILLQEPENPKLIDYATFFGSNQIFKYLYKNKAKITSSLWIYAIHSDHPEIIHLLEEIKVRIPVDQIYIESIRCHHNSISNYILSNYECKKEQYAKIRFFNFIQMEDGIFDEVDLTFLCEYDYSPVIKEYIKSTKFDFNKHIEREHNNGFSSDDEYSMLHYAIEHGSIETVRLLAACDEVDVNSPCTLTRFHPGSGSGLDGWNDAEIEFEVNFLLASIKKGIVDIVEILLENGASVDDAIKYTGQDSYDAKDYCTFSILYYAVKYENPEIVKIFLSKNLEKQENTFAYYNYDGNVHLYINEHKSSLHLAIENNNVEIVKLLIESGLFDVNDIKRCSHHRDELEEWSIGYKENTTSPLCIAVENNNIEIVKLLLKDKNLNVNRIKTSLDKSIRYNDGDRWNRALATKENDVCCDCCSKLNIKSFDVKSSQKSALHIAVTNNNIEIVRLLLENEKINVNDFCESDNRSYVNRKKNEEIYNKMTTLYIAIENNNIEIVKLLLKNDKIDVNLPSIHTISPCKFDSDEEEEDKEPVKKVNEKTPPLHFAIIKGNKEIINLLMEHKNIAVDLKDCDN